ncbi:hypothetical protein IWW36_003097 [Coemansia brasiliensis]|uniref:Fungal-type protein kinase domain-containing protein n=1 Tax=Coemansia brasiliensis TaxID=2650707 RepID=A0A9W8IDG9_9FUNG|nr:hypothetical protein IWW36_003097 [Coemansia brasiliensis]
MIADMIGDIFNSKTEHKYSFSEWTKESAKESTLYGYFSEFVLFVAQRVKEQHSATDGWRLILPSELSDFKPLDSNTSRRLDVSLFLGDIHDDVAASNVSDYADMFAIVEVKRGNRFGDTVNALSQLFVYSTDIYRTQLNRRFLWGLTICATDVCAEVIVHDKVLVSSIMDVRTAEGRKQLVSLLVHWSACSTERLGYDPSIRRREPEEGSQAVDGQRGVDKIRYDIDCYDDVTKEVRTYKTIRTILEAGCLFGRHTRTIIARPANCDNADTSDGSAQEVVIKDAWARYNADEDGARNEIGLLRTVRETFGTRKLDFIYPKLEVGGTVQVERDDVCIVDTTAAILDTLDADVREALNIPFRAHQHIANTPASHHAVTRAKRVPSHINKHKAV